MTMRDGTFCTILQGFPMLLILAQNNYRCLNTPLIYKPPAPTQSPEYLEALNTLYQHLFSQQEHDHGYGHGSYGQDFYGQGFYGSGQGTFGQHYPGHGNKYPSYDHGNKYPTIGHGVVYKPVGYPSSGHGFQGYPNFIYKKLNNGTFGKGYAPTQGNVKHTKYKIVVKKPKIINRRKKVQKLQEERCETIDKAAGSCINLLNCEPYLKIVKDSRSNPGTVALLRTINCGFDGKNPKVCCPRPRNIRGPLSPIVTTTPTPEETTSYDEWSVVDTDATSI